MSQIVQEKKSKVIKPSADLNRNKTSSNWLNFQLNNLKIVETKNQINLNSTSKSYKNKIGADIKKTKLNPKKHDVNNHLSNSLVAKGVIENKNLPKSYESRKKKPNITHHKNESKEILANTKHQIASKVIVTNKQSETKITKQNISPSAKHISPPAIKRDGIVAKTKNFPKPSPPTNLTMSPTTNLVVTDIQFFKQPGIIGSAGVRPIFTNDVCVAMDCEMVGTVNNANMLARVSLVNMSGQCIYDTFVAPQYEVTNYRTAVSGVRPHDVKYGADFNIVRQTVATLIHNRLLIGHAINNDLEVLGLSFRKRFIRDTSRYLPFRELLQIHRVPSLKLLAKELLNIDIQSGEHSSVEDARATMQIYVKFREEWENLLMRKFFKRGQQRTISK